MSSRDGSGCFDHYGWFGLSADAVLHGHRLWTLLSYNFLQNTAGYTGGVSSLIFNLLGLYFFGGSVRDLVGTRRFAWLYARLSSPSGAAGVVRRLSPWESTGRSIGPARHPGGHFRPVLLLPCRTSR